jgi:lambda family phage portal protein
VAGKRTFMQQQHQAMFSALERGDTLVVRRANTRRDALLTTCYQLVEADRLCNPMRQVDRPGLVAGIETDSDGRVVRYHVASTHPQEYRSGEAPQWSAVPAIGRDTGLPMAWDFGWKTRPDQTRAVPYLATVMETLKQIDRYGDAELMAAVVSAMFTVFVKSEVDVLGGISPGTDGATGKALPPEYKLAPGGIGRLLPGEDIVIADMKRPNTAFQPFVQAWAEQMGVALEIPYEILLKHFTSSYSAARGAQLEAWEPLWVRREWMAHDFCQPMYEAVVAEAVAREWIDAPGFFDDPWVRLAYTRARWVGDAPGQIDPRVEVEAAAARVREGFSTLEEETYGLTGGDWEENHAQQVIEKQLRDRDGLTPVAVPGGLPVAPPAPRDQGEDDEAEDDAASDRPAPGDEEVEAFHRGGRARGRGDGALHLALTVPPPSAAGTRTMTLVRDAKGAVTGATVQDGPAAAAPRGEAPPVQVAVTMPPATAATKNLTVVRDADGRVYGATVREDAS